MDPAPASSDGPDDTDGPDAVVEAIGKATEAFEYVERARGHLYSLHQLIGRADFLFEEAADLLERSGSAQDATRLRTEFVGRNVLDGRWTFQIVEEFDDLYYGPVSDELRRLEATHVGGERHAYESRLKDRRRSRGRAGHERRPPATEDADTENADTDDPDVRD